ncbi:MAG: hypothetical protein H8E26_12455 [FCB group bacterium]|nr:hypothetical protein [FCB group bacterium]MBL7028039.1 hypothetical protein [Candidatus Neomarinimicrobiota bacterium]MBL7122777.1 hypothetical protein [Candidatus Neomarinimicrobiota bacterium]
MSYVSNVATDEIFARGNLEEMINIIVIPSVILSVYEVRGIVVFLINDAVPLNSGLRTRGATPLQAARGNG